MDYAAENYLQRRRPSCPHGHFAAWLQVNFEGSERTARVYMWLAANRQRAANFESIRAALAFAEEPDKKVIEAELVEEPKEIVAELVEEPKPSRKAELVSVPGQERPLVLGGRPPPMMRGPVNNNPVPVNPNQVNANRQRTQEHLALACRYAQLADLSRDEILEMLEPLLSHFRLNQNTTERE